MGFLTWGYPKIDLFDMMFYLKQNKIVRLSKGHLAQSETVRPCLGASRCLGR